MDFDRPGHRQTVFEIDRHTLRRSGYGVTVLAHLFGIIAVVLLLVWLLHYREGIDLDSNDPSRIFNVHPFLMFSGFIFLAGEAMMAYKTVVATHEVQKLVHMFINLVAICLGIVGIHAVFKFHDRRNILDMYSLHSWIGMATFCLFILQWLFGFVVYLFPKASHATRAITLPWHICWGRALLFMAICTAETGLMEKFSFLNLVEHKRESHLVNIIGLAILLFGITVDISIVLPRLYFQPS